MGSTEIGLLLGILYLVTSSFAAICPEIAVSGTTYQTGSHGIYTLLEEDRWCEGEPAYSRSGNSYLYVSHLNTWVVGPELCGEAGGIHHIHEAFSGPDEVLKSWDEYDGEQWRANPSISVQCAQCTVLKLSGAVVTDIQQHNHGLYTKQEGSDCNGRTTYIMTSEPELNYIYYMEDHTNEHGEKTWKNDWLVSPGQCKDTAGIYSEDPAHSPDKVIGSWHEFDGDVSWIYSPTLRITCAECEVLEVRGSDHSPDDNGLYHILPGARSHNRPVYMKVAPPVLYIYYKHKILTDHDRDNDLDIRVPNVWILSDTLHDTLYNTLAYDSSVAPDMVESPWEVFDEESGDWQETSMTVTCFRRPDTADPSEYSAPESECSIDNYQAVIPAVLFGILFLVMLLIVVYMCWKKSKETRRPIQNSRQPPARPQVQPVTVLVADGAMGRPPPYTPAVMEDKVVVFENNNNANAAVVHEGSNPSASAVSTESAYHTANGSVTNKDQDWSETLSRYYTAENPYQNVSVHGGKSEL